MTQRRNNHYVFQTTKLWTWPDKMPTMRQRRSRRNRDLSALRRTRRQTDDFRAQRAKRTLYSRCAEDSWHARQPSAAATARRQSEQGALGETTPVPDRARTTRPIGHGLPVIRLPLTARERQTADGRQAVRFRPTQPTSGKQAAGSARRSLRETSGLSAFALELALFAAYSPASRSHRPVLPPSFLSRRTSIISMPRSTALHMS